MDCPSRVDDCSFDPVMYFQNAVDCPHHVDYDCSFAPSPRIVLRVTHSYYCEAWSGNQAESIKPMVKRNFFATIILHGSLKGLSARPFEEDDMENKRYALFHFLS